MTFHDKLVSELNDKHGHLELRWHNSSYANDACGSAMFEIDNMKETYIQLHAFETPEEAREEGLEQFSITISFFGDIDYAAYVGDDRDQCIKEAIAAADRFFEKHHHVTRLYIPITEYQHTDMVDDMIGGVYVYKHAWEEIDYDTPISNWHILVVSDGNEEAYGGKYHLFLPQEDHISDDLAELETMFIMWVREEGYTMPDAFPDPTAN